MAEKKVVSTKSSADAVTEVEDDGKVTVFIPKEPGVKDQIPVYVNANGNTALIERGKYVRVHPLIAEVLRETQMFREEADEYYSSVSQ